MAYRNTFFRWLFLYSLTFGLTYVLKLFTYLCPETGQGGSARGRETGRGLSVSRPRAEPPLSAGCVHPCGRCSDTWGE